MNFISSNIRYIRKTRHLTQEQFADDLGWTKSMVGAYEESRSEPSIEKLIKLSVYSSIPIDILVKNDLRLAKDTSFIEVGNKRVLFPIAVNDENENLIEVVPAKASAGYLAGYDDPEYIQQLENIKLPFIPTGKHRAFPIKGDSMLPLKEGSYVIGEFVESRTDIRSNTTYVLLTLNEGMVYKRVINNIAQNNTLRLVSDNPTYPAYDVNIDEVIELWKFTCAINTQEYTPEELKISSITNMFNALGVELKALKGALK